MNLHRMLQERAAAGRPLRVALIGAGKFGAMYLAQAKHTPGIHVVAIADLAPERAKASLARTGWPAERFAARTIAEAGRAGTTCVTDDALATTAAHEVEIVIDATGSPAAGIRHALACCTHGKHVVMVNVEADALAGPLLAQRAREAGVVYSLAYGDQPALISEMVDWARTAGFEVVAAGKGTKYLPAYHASTPATVWPHYGFTPEMVAAGDFNAQMFNSFLDGTKSAIEMAAWRRWRTQPGSSPRRRASRSRPAASTTCRASSVRATRAASSTTPARSRWSRRSNATAGRCSATCAGAST